MSNQQLYENLQKNFGKVTVLKNGMYHAVASNGDEFYINPNDPNVNLHVYLPGLGGGKHRVTNSFRNIMESSTVPSYSIVLANQYEDKKNVLNKAYNTIIGSGYSLNALEVSGNSASGGTAISRASSFLINHPEYADRTAIILNDAYNMERSYTKEQRKVLYDNQIPIIFVTPSRKYSVYGSNRVRKWTTPFTSSGFNVICFDSEDTGHNELSEYSFINRIPEYVFGLTNEVGNDGRVRAANYVAYKYNKETKQYERVELSSAQLKTIYKAENIEVFNPSLYTSSDRFSIVNEDLDAYHNFSDLKSIQDVSINIPSSLANAETIKSDTEFITSSMNAIRSQIKASGFLNNVNLPKFRSYSGIPGCIGEYIDKYYDYIGDLMDLLVEETTAVTSLGQVMADMDSDIAERGSALGEVKELERVPVQRIKTYKDRTEPTEEEVNVIPDSDEDESPGRYGSRSGPGSSKETKYDIKDFLNYKRDDGSLLLIKKDGNDISEVFYRYEYKTPDQAEYMRDKIYEKWKNVDYVDKVENDSNFVYIKFKNNAFENMSLDEIKEKYK